MLEPCGWIGETLYGSSSMLYKIRSSNMSDYDNQKDALDKVKADLEDLKTDITRELET